MPFSCSALRHSVQPFLRWCAQAGQLSNISSCVFAPSNADENPRIVATPYAASSTRTRVPAPIAWSSCEAPSFMRIFHRIPFSCSDFRHAPQPPLPAGHVWQLSKTMLWLFAPIIFARKPSIVPRPYAASSTTMRLPLGISVSSCTLPSTFNIFHAVSFNCSDLRQTPQPPE